MDRHPLISVVTPVYNGEKYLAECIESVLAQSYENWEYVIVNNRSTDRTLEIAQEFARQHDRIRVHDNTDFLPLMQNWNHAIRQISINSKYCKVVHADDYLFPSCLEKMAEIAEANPTIGVVGSYRLKGHNVRPHEWPHATYVVSGREVCRAYLAKGLSDFGSSTSSLLKSDLIRSRKAFYNESNLHADTEAYFDILRDSDFGFVPQILTFTRLHDESVTTYFEALGTNELGNIRILIEYGPSYLSEEEFRQCLGSALSRDRRFLCASIFRGNSKQVWNYHKRELNELGYPLNISNMAMAFSAFALGIGSNPKESVIALFRRAKHSLSLGLNAD